MTEDPISSPGKAVSESPFSKLMRQVMQLHDVLTYNSSWTCFLFPPVVNLSPYKRFAHDGPIYLVPDLYNLPPIKSRKTI